MHLNNRCIPDVLSDIVSHGVHDPEEFPFLEEVHILRRLQVSYRQCMQLQSSLKVCYSYPFPCQATLFACRNWVEAKSASNIQAWKVADFFIINHGDLSRMLPSFDLLQVLLNKIP